MIQRQLLDRLSPIFRDACNHLPPLAHCSNHWTSIPILSIRLTLPVPIPVLILLSTPRETLLVKHFARWSRSQHTTTLPTNQVQSNIHSGPLVDCHYPDTLQSVTKSLGHLLLQVPTLCLVHHHIEPLYWQSPPHPKRLPKLTTAFRRKDTSSTAPLTKSHLNTLAQAPHLQFAPRSLLLPHPSQL